MVMKVMSPSHRVGVRQPTHEVLLSGHFGTALFYLLTFTSSYNKVHYLVTFGPTMPANVVYSTCHTVIPVQCITMLLFC